MNMNSLIFIGLSFLVALAVAQKPTPCTTPPQWEGRYFGYDMVSNASFRGHFAYDSINRRERLIEEYVLGSDDDVFENLYLHNLQIEYSFNLRTKVCKKQPITRPWRDFGIPQNATFLGESYLGSSAVPNANLLVTIWKDQFIDSQGDTATWIGTWTYQACLPVSMVFTSPKYNTNDYSFDLTLGIADPNQFLPRPECQNA